MRRALVVAVLALLAAPGVARGQDFESGVSVFLVPFGGATPVREAQASVVASGAVTVTFHSDPATCATVGRCALDGTLVWRAPGRATLFAAEYDPGRVETPLTASLFLGGDPFGDSATTTVVRRGVPGGSRVCADAASPNVSFEGAGSLSGGVDLMLGGDAEGILVATRCPGPGRSDVAAAMPRLHLSREVLRRGRTRIDLGSERPFTAAGLTGTVRSTVVLDVGRMRVSRQPRSGPPEHPRHRVVGTRYRIERVSGRVAADVFGGSRAQGCEALDACGARGTTILAPRATRGSLILQAFARRHASRRGLLAALGRRRGRIPGGVDVFGTGGWRDHGSAAVALSRAGGPACTDSGALRTGLLTLGVRKRRVQIGYVPLEGAPTRCGGPGLGEPDGTPLAQTTVPLRTFGRRRIVLHLRGVRHADGEAYRTVTRARMTIVLRRTGATDRRI